MLKLRINTTKGPIDKDSQIPPSDLSEVQYLELVPRGSEGVGSFKGRSPNKVTIWCGPRYFKNVVLPDNFDWETVTGFTIYDSSKTLESLQFTADEANPKLLWAGQKARQEEQTKGTDRWATMIKSFQKQFPAAGGIGCNDTGDSLIVTVEVPADHNTREYREALAAHAEAETSRFNCDVQVIIKPVGVGRPEAHPLLENKLGEARYPTIPVAGQQNLQLVEAGAHPTPGSATALRPFEGDPSGSEGPLQPGQSFEPYGSKGPQDNK